MRQHDYERLGRQSKGLVRRYVAKMTGLSRAQVKRLIGAYLEGKQIRFPTYRRHRFGSRYKAADIELLAEVDEAPKRSAGRRRKRFCNGSFTSLVTSAMSGSPRFR